MLALQEAEEHSASWVSSEAAQDPVHWPRKHLSPQAQGRVRGLIGL